MDPLESRLVAGSFSRHQDEKSTDDMPFRHADCGYHRCLILWGQAPPTNSDHGIMVAKSGDLYTPVVATPNPKPATLDRLLLAGDLTYVILTTVQSQGNALPAVLIASRPHPEIRNGTMWWIRNILHDSKSLSSSYLGNFRTEVWQDISI